MAISVNNPLTHGLSGMFGDLIVFRNIRGKTILANRPCKPRKQSELQRENRMRFRKAAMFAKAAMQDIQKKEYYRNKARKMKLPNAYTAAITDYMRKAVVTEITALHGSITITAWKKGFTLASVEVAWRDAQGSTLAAGMAVPDNNIKDRWRAISPIPLPPVTEVMVTVQDQAGNICCARQSMGNQKQEVRAQKQCVRSGGRPSFRSEGLLRRGQGVPFTRNAQLF